MKARAKRPAVAVRATKSPHGTPCCGHWLLQYDARHHNFRRYNHEAFRICVARLVCCRVCRAGAGRGCRAATRSAGRAGVYRRAGAGGGAVYAQNCSACHGANFEGSGDAPALAGGTFRLKWGPKMVSELFGLILQTMPPTNPGSLGEAAALNATAFILQRNGAQPGQTALTPARRR